MLKGKIKQRSVKHVFMIKCIGFNTSYKAFMTSHVYNLMRNKDYKVI